MAKSTSLDIILRMKDEASKHLKGFKANMQGAEAASKKFGLALGGVSLAAVGLASKLAIDAAQNERVMITFDSLAKSIGASENAIGGMRDATMGLVDDVSLMESGNKLIAMGLAGTEGEMRELMNTAVRLGSAMGTGPTASMENFALMLANQSIPRLDTFGISSGRVRARIEELMSANAGMSRETAFMTATMEAAKSSLEKLGDFVPTAGEEFEQFKVKLLNAKQAIGEQLIPVMIPLLDHLVDFAQNKLPTVIQKIGQFINWITQLTQWLNQHKEVLIIVGATIFAALLPAIYAAITAFIAAAVALAPFIIGGAIIGGIIAGIYLLITNWDLIKEKTASVFGWISNFMKDIWNGIKALFESMGKSLHDTWTGFWDGLAGVVTNVWEGIKNTIKGSINWVIGKINDFIAKANDVLRQAASAVGMTAPVIPSIPKLAKGGIVTRPTLALIGEAGPEAVVPLSGANGRAAAAAGFGGGGGITINFNGPMQTSRQSAREFADEVAMMIKQRIKV